MYINDRLAARTRPSTSSTRPVRAADPACEQAEKDGRGRNDIEDDRREDRAHPGEDRLGASTTATNSAELDGRSASRVIFGQDDGDRRRSARVSSCRAPGCAAPTSRSAAFLFAGPTGVGKTELAKQLAAMLGVEFLRFDMSEYMRAPHGHHGSSARRPATSASTRAACSPTPSRKHPHSVRACSTRSRRRTRMIFNILLQVMDHGDADGQQRPQGRFPQRRAHHDDERGRPRSRRSSTIGFGANAGVDESRARSAIKTLVHARVPQPARRDGSASTALDPSRSSCAWSTRRSCRSSRRQLEREEGRRLPHARGAHLARRARLRPGDGRAPDGAARRAAGQEGARRGAALRRLARWRIGRLRRREGWPVPRAREHSGTELSTAATSRGAAGTKHQAPTTTKADVA